MSTETRLYSRDEKPPANLDRFPAKKLLATRRVIYSITDSRVNNLASVGFLGMEITKYIPDGVTEPRKPKPLSLQDYYDAREVYAVLTETPYIQDAVEGGFLSENDVHVFAGDIHLAQIKLEIELEDSQP